MVVGRGGESNFCEFDRGPGAPTGEGDERVNDCDGVRVGHTHNVFIVHVVGENTGIGMQVSKVSVIQDAVVVELHRGESHGGHEFIGFGLGNGRSRDVHLDMGLGNHRGESLAAGVDRKSFEPVGGFWKQGGVQAHPVKIVAKRAVIHAKVEALEPPAHFLIVIDMVLGSAAMALSLPGCQKRGFVKDGSVGLDPAPEVGAGGAINRTEAAQLAEILRELWDFR